MSDKVQNYYETLVFDELERQLEKKGIQINENQFSDMSCVALNRLPARYVRYAIDTTFYATPGDLQEMEDNVKNAVNHAISFIMEKSTN